MMNLIIKYILFVTLLCNSAYAAQVSFQVRGQTIRVMPLGNKGQNIYLNDKLIHFVPISNRGDISNASKVISDYGLNPEQISELDHFLGTTFDSTMKAPDNKDLVAASFQIAKEASDIMSQEVKEDCLKTSEPVKEVAIDNLDDEIYCECQLPKELQIADEDYFKVSEGFEDEYWDDYSLIGEVEEISFSLDSTNDNHLHGLWRRIASPELDGNDRGRTFGLNLDYKAVGDLGEIQIAFESVLFTQLYETSPGSGLFFLNQDDQYFQDQAERNTLDLKLLRRTGLGDDFVIAGFELQQLTDDGNVAGPIQDAWHELLKKENAVQYTNQNYMEDDLDLTLYGGLGKDWFSDLGNWKCRSRLEGTIGVNVLDTEDVFIKTRGEVELNSNKVFGGTEDNPWFLVSMWAEGSLENQGENQYGAGVSVKSPIRVGDWTVEPKIGMSIEVQKEDFMFSQAQSRKIEPQSHIGITFRRKF